jgi:hypothetical protein
MTNYTMTEKEIATLKDAIKVIHELADKVYPDYSNLDEHYANIKMHDMTYNLKYLLAQFGQEGEAD